MARPRRQPKQGRRSRRERKGRFAAPLPRSLTGGESASFAIPLTFTVGATTLATTQVGYTQLSGIARWANLASYFVDVRFIDVTFLPTNLAAAGFLEMSFLRKHLPYNPTSSDSSSAAPYSTASLALLPGYQKWTQGNGLLNGRTFRLNYRMRVATFNADQPVLFEFMSYASAATSMLAFLRVSLASIVTGI